MFQRAFSVSTREPAALLFAPGGHSPTGVFVAWCNVGTFVRLCFGVSCGIARARSFVCDHVHARRGRRGHGVAVAVPWRGRRALDVVASLDVAVARRGRGCGAHCLCVAVVWLRHADEC